MTEKKYAKGMLKDDALQGKNIIVTGGGSGLGFAMTKYFLEVGAKVVITSRNEAKLKKASEKLKAETGGEVLTIGCDIREYDQVESMLDASISSFGQIDGVLNNAAGNFVSPTERLSHRAFNVIVDIVLKGTSNVTLAAGKKWIEKEQSGVFLNIITTYAYTGSGYVVPSATAKAGVMALTRSLAVEWAKYGIRSNAIAPGPFPTEGAWQRLLPPQIAKDVDPVHRIPLGRVGDHQELANLAAYMISDYSAYMNGEIVTLDGGEWLKQAGQFSGMEAISQEMWDAFEAFRKGAGK